VTYQKLTELFLTHHRQNQSAANTVVFYRTQLGQLGRAGLHGQAIDKLTPADILGALAEANDGKSPTTQRHRAVAVDQLQKYAVTLGLLSKPWCSKLPKPTPRQRDRIPTDAETKALLRHSNARFRLIYQALRLSGARPNELCRAQISNFEPDSSGETGVIVLQEHKTARKSGKPRTIVVGRKLGKLLRLAIGKRKSGPLFQAPRGNGWTVKNLSTQFLRARTAAGLDRELVLYSARHEAGTAFCKEHGILKASRLLGHATINTTQRYVHPDLEELKQAQDAAHG
jgi:integrase